MGEYNSTFFTFNGPSTQIAEYEHWSVLVRPKQCTQGALVLLANGSEVAFSQLPPLAFAEMQTVIQDIESVLSSLFSFEKINYLMLMMVDPHVHFHVLPRYSISSHFLDWEMSDPGWPGQPDLSSGSSEPELIDALRARLRDAWPSASRRT